MGKSFFDKSENFLLELLAEAVNKALQEGWELAGGVAVTVSNVTENDRGERESNAFYFYYQAMSK